MNWTELLKSEMEGTYGATLGLLDLVEDEALGYQPETGSNWMTLGQLLMHLTTACGFCCRGIATGDWGMPEGQAEEMSSEEMLPPAEKMPAVETVAQARKMLEADRDLALAMVDEVGEADLDGKEVTVPWNTECPRPLGEHFLHMVGHLASHKSQLFYYLKLLGKPVHTGHLWGM